MQRVIRYFSCPRAILSLALTAILLSTPARCADTEATLLRPKRYTVNQREGFVPAKAHENHSGGPALGFGKVPLEAEFRGEPDAVMDCRAVALAGAFGRGMDWTPLQAARSGTRWSASAEVPAGGWYRLEVRWRKGDRVLGTAAVEPFGVGEVFLIAGQSYAAGWNDELTRVDDPAGRVAAYNPKQKSWQIAHDPQPADGRGGTIWPPMANALVPMVRVPIGLVNVAVGATASRQWLPGQPLFENLATAGSEVGRFRAVLWQQGESDVIEKTDAATYVTRLVAIRQAAATRWGFDPPWLLAKSTLHPTVYSDPLHEGQIREAIDRLWRLPGFRPGPDTDVLGGENRGGAQSMRHFSPIGQRRAGLLWFAAVWNELNQ
jgi:hypothetical protein